MCLYMYIWISSHHSVYTLWQAGNMLKCVYTWQPVLEKLLGGAGEMICWVQILPKTAQFHGCLRLLFSNPRCTCAARVTVVGVCVCVCLSVCLPVCVSNYFSNMVSLNVAMKVHILLA